MKKTFEDFLMDKHSEQYCGTDDLMIDDFNDWLVELQADEIIEYANKYIKQQRAKLISELEEIMKNRKNNVYASIEKLIKKL